MSRTVDSRVVEMEFDNSKFEKNIKQSTKSIEGLKSSIDGLESSGGSSKAEEALEKIADRCSALGVAGATVIAKLTSSAMDAISKISSSLNSLVVQGGLTRSMNIEKAKFQLEGLGIEWESVFSDINYAVSGTAYGLDAAALAASNLAASGVAYDDVAETLTDVNQIAENGSENLSSMAQALGAISGVAAMTSSEFSDISSIFSTVAGQGVLMTQQLRQLESRGMNAAAKIGEALGKSEEEVREMVTAGEIDFATFSKVMYDEFYSHAKDANKTVTGVLSNIKAAFAKIGAEFFTPIIKNEGPLVDMLNAFRTNVNAVKKAILPIINLLSEVAIKGINAVKDALESMDFEGMQNKIKKFFGVFNDAFAVRKFRKLKAELGETWETFATFLIDAGKEAGTITADMDVNTKNFLGTLRQGWLTFSVFDTAIENITKALTGTEDAANATGASLQDLSEIVQQVIHGDWDNGQARIEALTTAGYDWATVQNLVNEELGSSVRHLSDLTDAEQSLSDEQLSANGYSAEQIKLLRRIQEQADTSWMTLHELIDEVNNSPGMLILHTVDNILTALKNFREAVAAAWKEVFPGSAKDMLTSLLQILYKFSNFLVLDEGALEGLKNTFKGLFSILSLGVYIIKSVLKGIETLLNNLTGANFTIFDITGKIGDAIYQVVNFIKTSDVLGTVFTSIGNALAWIIELIKMVVEKIKSSTAFQSIMASIKNIFSQLGDILKKNFSNVGEIFDKLFQNLKNIKDLKISSIVGAFKELGTTIKTDLLGSLSSLSTFGEKITGMFKGIPNLVKNIDFGPFTEFFNKLGSKISEGFANIDFMQVFAAILSTFFAINIAKITKKFGSLQDSLAGFFDSLKAGMAEIEFQMASKVKAEAFEATAKGVDLLAGALLKLVISIAILALIPIENLKKAGAVMAALAICLGVMAAGVMLLASKIGVNGGMAIEGQANTIASIMAIVAFITALSIAMILFVTAIAKLAKLATNANADLGTAMTIFGNIFAGLAAIIVVVSLMSKLCKDGYKTMLTTSLFVVAMAASMLIIVNAIRKLAKVASNNPSGLMGAMLVISTIMGLMVGMLAATRIAGKSSLSASLFVASIATSLLLIAVVIKIMASMDQEGLARGLSVVYILGLFFVGLLAAMKFLNQGGNVVDQAALVILSISVCLLSITFLMKQIAKMTPEEVARGIATVYAIGGVFAALLIVLHYFNGPEYGLANSVTILAVAACLVVLAISLKILSTIKPEKLIAPTLALITIMGALGVTFAMAKKMGASKATVVGIAVALAILAAALVILSFIEPTKLIAPTLALCSVMAALSLVFMSISKMKSDHMGQTVGYVVLMIAVIAALGGLFFILGNLPHPEACLPIAAGISVLLLALSASMLIINKMGDSKSKFKDMIPTLAIMLVALASVSLVLGLLVSTIGDKANAAIPIAIAVGVLLIALSAAMTVMVAAASLSSILPTSVAGIASMMVMMTVVLAEVTAVLAILVGLKNADKAPMICEALGKFLIELTAAMLIMAIAADLSINYYGFALQLLMMTAILAEVTGVISILAGLKNINQMPMICSSLGDFLIKLVSAMMVMAIASDLTFNVIGAGVMIGGMVTILTDIAAIVAVLQGLGNIGKMEYICDQLGSLIERLADVMLELSTMGFSSIAAAIGVNAMAELIVVMTTIVAALGALAQQFDGLDDLIEKGIKILVVVGEGIGCFLGAIVDGFAMFATKDSEELGERLSQFFDALKPSIEYISDLDDTAIKGVKVLTGFILALTAAEFISAVISGVQKLTRIDLTGAFSGMLSSVKGITSALSGFDQTSVDAAEQVANIIQSLTAFQAVAELDELTSMILGPFGNRDAMTTFVNMMSKLGEGISSFASETSSLSTDSVTKFSLASKGLNYISEASKNMPKSGGLSQLITGHVDLGNFATNIEALGKCIRDSAYYISGITDTDIDQFGKVADITKQYSDVANEIPIEGGSLAAWVTGEKIDLGVFGDNIATLCQAMADAAQSLFDNGLVEYSENELGEQVASMTAKLEAMKTIVPVIQTYADIADNLPVTYDMTGSTNRLSDFATALPTLALNLNTFVETVDTATFNSDGMDTVITEVDILCTGLARAMGSLENVQPNAIKQFSGFVGVFGTTISEVAGAVEEIDGNSTKYTHLTSIFGEGGPAYKLLDFCQKVTESGITDWSLIKSFGGQNGALKKIGKGIAGYYEAINEAGVTDWTVVKNSGPALSALLSGIVTALNGNNNALYNVKTHNLPKACTNIGEGLKNYFNEISGMTDEDFNLTEASSQSLVNICSTLATNSSGLSSLDIPDTLSSDLSKVGEGMHSYFNEVSDITTGQASTMESVSESLGTIFVALKDFPTNYSLIDFDSFDTDMSNLGAGLDNLALSGKNLDTEGVQAEADGLSTIAEAINGVEVTSEDIVEFKDTMGELGTTAIDEFIENISGDVAKDTIKTAVTDFLQAAEDDVNDLVGSTDDVNSYAYQFYQTGVFFTRGFQEGMLNASALNAVGAAAMVVGQRAIDDLKAKLEEQSPSKATKRMGAYFSEGLGIGISNMADYVGRESENLGETAIDGLSVAIESIGELVNADMDVTPTVTPVVDLSNVQSGITTMNSMFGSTQLAYASSSASYGMSRIQNGRVSNYDVVNAINGLNDRLGSSEINSYTINGITYDDGSNVATAVQSLIHAAKVERRMA